MTDISDITNKRSVLFCRISSREQEMGQSIDAQLQNLRSYCKRQSFSVIKEYTITESSTRGDRKKFTEMLSFVKQQKTKIIIVADCVDRIQRSFRESIELSDLVHANKIEIHFVRENLIISSESNTRIRIFFSLSSIIPNLQSAKEINSSSCVQIKNAGNPLFSSG